MSNAAPPAWVLALPLDSGQWRFLSRAWGWGPFKNSKPDAPPLTESVRVTASNATIGARSGQSKGAASKQASKLCAAGWARRNDDNSLTLAAWRAPGVFEVEVAVARGLVRRADDGKLTWPDTLQGGTPPPTGLGATPQGATPTGLDPTPHREVGHPPQEPSTPPQGVQSYESSLSSFGHEVEARDPHPDDLGPAPTPPPEASRLQARQPVTPKPSSVVNNDWRKNRARIQLEAQRERGDASWSSDLTEAQLEAVDTDRRPAWHRAAVGGNWAKAMQERADALGLDDAGLGRAMARWDAEAAEAPRGVKPGQPARPAIWYSRHSEWVRKAAGLGDSTPTNRSPNGQSAHEAVMAKVEAKRALSVVS